MLHSDGFASWSNREPTAWSLASAIFRSKGCRFATETTDTEHLSRIMHNDRQSPRCPSKLKADPTAPVATFYCPAMETRWAEYDVLP